jgi:hypothetical protein
MSDKMISMEKSIKVKEKIFPLEETMQIILINIENTRLLNVGVTIKLIFLSFWCMQLKLPLQILT